MNSLETNEKSAANCDKYMQGNVYLYISVSKSGFFLSVALRLYVNKKKNISTILNILQVVTLMVMLT